MKFNVHKHLLCHHSPFFEGALKPAFKEGQENIVTLPEEEAYVFSVFLHWLYTGSLPALKNMPKRNGKDPASLYLRTFFLADRLLVDKLQGQCYARIRKNLALGTTLSADFINDLYDLADENFKLRTFVCNLAAHLIVLGDHLGEEWYTLLTTRDEFAADVARLMAFKCSNALRNADPREDKRFDAWEDKIDCDVGAAQNVANNNVPLQQVTIEDVRW